MRGRGVRLDIGLDRRAVSARPRSLRPTAQRPSATNGIPMFCVMRSVPYVMQGSRNGTLMSWNVGEDFSIRIDTPKEAKPYYAYSILLPGNI